MSTLQKELSEFLARALSRAFGAVCSPEEALASFEVPREEKFGELSTNLVFRLSKGLKKPPRRLAEETLRVLEAELPASPLKDRISKIAVEGPGFINFYYSDRQIAEVIPRIKEAGDDFGRPYRPKRKNILLEFVSANPTGPLTVAHGRQAALGDSLARILQFCGHRVTKEYYNNDEGVQINLLGESMVARCLDREVPENGYRGDYLIELAAGLKKKLESEGIALGRDRAADTRVCAEFAKNGILRGIQKDLKDFGVEFDNLFSQEALMKSGKVEATLEKLKEKGFVYEKEGASWFESTRFGDDKDRVLIKSDKSYTYFTPDIAYHRDKFERGFDFLIDILGPDHHGYIPRIRAAVEALGFRREALEVLIAQLVTLFEGEKALRMSTRAGEFVTLREIIDEVGKDAGRFFFLMRKFDAHLDFDLALAKSQTLDNPVFYIQYAHARIESIRNLLSEKKIKLLWEPACLSRLTGAREVSLMRLLDQFELTLSAAERTLEPYRLVSYLRDLAGAFHRFYAEHRVVTDDGPLTQARLMLSFATQSVLRQGLNLLGVSAPFKM